MSKRRARRMAKNHKRMAKPAKLNLVALMDIFTILVLFLIVNNGDVEVLQADKKVALPDSVSEQRPEATNIIKVTPTEILLDEVAVSTVEEALAGEDEAIAGLASALEAAAVEADKSLETTLALLANQDAAASNGRPIVIMGDAGTPYALLKRIMATCAATDFRDISLAVNSVPVEGASSQDTDTLAMAGVSP